MDSLAQRKDLALNLFALAQFAAHGSPRVGSQPKQPGLDFRLKEPLGIARFRHGAHKLAHALRARLVQQYGFAVGLIMSEGSAGSGRPLTLEGSFHPSANVTGEISDL
jgi:hypothetical protein